MPEPLVRPPASLASPPVAVDRIVAVRVRGMRVLKDVHLPLHGLTTVIGDNGCGKSSLIEALELVRKVAFRRNFVQEQLGPFHGGLGALLRSGETELRITVRVEGAGPPLEYTVGFSWVGNLMKLSFEQLESWQGGSSSEPVRLVEHDLSQFLVFDDKKKQFVMPTGDPPSIAGVQWIEQPVLARMIAALNNIAVHVPFDVRPPWTEENQPTRALARSRTLLNEAPRLERLGGNLASCFHELRQRPGWVQTLERVRMGLGLDVSDVVTVPRGQGEIEVAVKFGSKGVPVPAYSLSSGQLSYLAFLALVELGASYSLVAFDEPELHMNPMLLARVVTLLEGLAEKCPVLVATHSDVFLDALSEESARNITLCELDEDRSTQLFRPDPTQLSEWLSNYRGVGTIRQEGYGPHLMTVPLKEAP
jgi:predicted ATPase